MRQDTSILFKILRSLPRPVFIRAHDYAIEGRVGEIKQHNNTLQAEVMGSDLYQASIYLGNGKNECTCPAPKPCKHVGALAVVALNLMEGRSLPTASAPPLVKDQDLAVRIHEQNKVALYSQSGDGSLLPLATASVLKEELQSIAEELIRFSRNGKKLVGRLLEFYLENPEAVKSIHFYSGNSKTPAQLAGTTPGELRYYEHRGLHGAIDPYSLGACLLYFEPYYTAVLPEPPGEVMERIPSSRPLLRFSKDQQRFYIITKKPEIKKAIENITLTELAELPDQPLYKKWQHAIENAATVGPRLILSIMGVENEKTGRFTIEGKLEIAYAHSESDFEEATKTDKVVANRPLYCISIFSVYLMRWGITAAHSGRDGRELMEHKTGTLIRRSFADEIDLLEDARFLDFNEEGKMRIAKKNLAQFLEKTVPRARRRGIVVRINDNIVGLIQKPRGALVIYGASNIDWFSGRIEVEGMDADDLGTVIHAIRHKNELVKLKNGNWLNIHGSELEEVIQSLERLGIRTKSDGMIEKISFAEFASLEAEKLIELRTEEGAKKAREKIRSLLATPLPKDKPPAELKATLRPYQLEGMRFLLRLYRSGIGGILADDMGLGKTVQAIAAMATIAFAKSPAKKEKSRFLVVCPVAALGVWENEIQRFAPGLICYRWHGASRNVEDAQDAHVVLTTFATYALDADKITAEKWQIAFIDEAQFAKNFRTKKARELRKIKADAIICLTGTPLENYLEDLWSLFDLIFPGYLGNEKRFRDFYGGHLQVKDAQGLQRKIRPFMLRRRKQDVLTELPEKSETVIKVPMTLEQKKVYEAARRRALEFLQDSGIAIFDMLRHLSALRRIACHPYLEAENPDPMLSGKFEYLESKLEELAISSEGILIFSQYTDVLKVLHRMMAKRGIEAFYLDGQTTEKKRRTLVERFQNGEEKFFLISLKAGGTALTLTRADTVIHLDPWWNPAVENQATDRAHRIGQKKRVMVYKLVSEGTVEEKVLVLQSFKRELFDEVIDAHAGNAKRITKEDIAELL